MADRDYDEAIAKHYRQVAETDGLSWSSTMADEITREIETESILGFVADFAKQEPGGGPLRVVDAGCGNGHTLGELAGPFGGHRFTGIEKSAELRALAQERVRKQGLGNVEIHSGDVRDASFAGEEPFDILLCQRVLINLLDPDDQKTALDNMIAAVRPGGGLLFIEAFQSGLGRINEARAEFDLPPIPPAHHNLYLPDGFFDHGGLVPYESGGWSVPPNAFSTHYFVSRVFFPVVWGDRPFRRNTAFVKFFSRALKPGVGDFTQLQIHALRRRPA